MVEVDVQDDVLTIDVQGIHKLWAFKSTLRIPLSDVVSIRHDPDRASSAFPGLRVPGTHIPTVYSAGTFYQSDFRPDFWLVRHPENAVVIQCRKEAAYDEIIVEVEHPTSLVARIQRKLDRRSA